MDFQIDVNHLAAHWKGFEDPHSGIAYYTVGAGTDTFQYDVEPRINVGLRTGRFIIKHFKLSIIQKFDKF